MDVSNCDKHVEKSNTKLMQKSPDPFPPHAGDVIHPVKGGVRRLSLTLLCCTSPLPPDTSRLALNMIEGDNDKC